MHDSELIRRYTLDRTGIMFVSDLIKYMLTSPTPRRNAIAPEIDVITTLTYLLICQLEKCNYAAAMIWVCTCDSTFRTLLWLCSFPIKYVKYDSMVNIKNIEYIYIYNVCVCVCVCVWERERES